MTVTIQVGTNGREMTLNNSNFAWLVRSLGLPGVPDTEAWLPSQVLAACKVFSERTSGYYNDPDLVARIFEYLAPVNCPFTQAVIDSLAGTDGTGAQVIDGSGVDWSNLGKLSDPCSDANYLWDRLRGYVRDLRWLAQAAQKEGEIIRLY